MKIQKVCTCMCMLILVQGANSAEVMKEAPDKTGGSIMGFATGFLWGGAVAGGPIGAIVGGIAGLASGSVIQEKAGLSGQAYIVKTASGKEIKVRSPNRKFAIGDAAEVNGNRLQ